MRKFLFFILAALLSVGSGWADATKLNTVTSVTSGNYYVFNTHNQQGAYTKYYLYDNNETVQAIELDSLDDYKKIIWKVVSKGNNLYTFQNVATKKYLTIPSNNVNGNAVKTSVDSVSMYMEIGDDNVGMFLRNTESSPQYIDAAYSGHNIVSWKVEGLDSQSKLLQMYEVGASYNDFAYFFRNTVEIITVPSVGLYKVTSNHTFVTEMQGGIYTMPINLSQNMALLLSEKEVLNMSTLNESRLPFTLTTITDNVFASDTKWYYLKQGSQYVGYDNDAEGKSTIGANEYNAKYMWCFVKDANTPCIYIYNKAVGASMALGEKLSGDDYANYHNQGFCTFLNDDRDMPLWLRANTSNNGTYTFQLAASDVSGTCILGRHVGSKLSIWGNGADVNNGSSSFTFKEVDFAVKTSTDQGTNVYYQIKNNGKYDGISYYLNPYTNPTSVESERGLYQFYAATNKGEYYIKEVATGKWLNYNNTSNGTEKVSFSTDKDKIWAVNFNPDNSYYTISPSEKFDIGFNWFNGLKDIYTGDYPTKTIGFYNNTDPYSKWVLEEVVDNVDAVKAALPLTRAKLPAKPYYNHVGEGLGKYHFVKDSKTKYSGLKEAIDACSTVEQANAISNSIEINQPTSGFYYIKNKGTQKYVKGEKVGDGQSVVSLQNEQNANAIFYIDAEKNIMAYENGAYWKNVYRLGDGDTYKDPWEFSEGNSIGSYYLRYGTNDRYYATASSTTSTGYNAAAPANDNGSWELIKVTTLPLTIGTNGWSTFSAPVKVALPAEGVKAFYVKSGNRIENNALTLDDVEGNIPANQGVIIKGPEKETIDISILEGTPETADLTGNQLVANVDGKEITGTGGDGIYAFATYQSKTGFMKLMTTVTLGGHKCYLKLKNPAPAGSASFLSLLVDGDDDLTGVEGVDTEVESDGIVYDLFGRKVSQPQKGSLYIRNGRKFIAK